MDEDCNNCQGEQCPACNDPNGLVCGGCGTCVYCRQLTPPDQLAGGAR